MTVYYSRSLTEQADRTLRVHAADVQGMCAGCHAGGVLVPAGECEASLWAEHIQSVVAEYGEPVRG